MPENRDDNGSGLALILFPEDRQLESARSHLTPSLLPDRAEPPPDVSVVVYPGGSGPGAVELAARIEIGLAQSAFTFEIVVVEDAVGINRPGPAGIGMLAAARGRVVAVCAGELPGAPGVIDEMVASVLAGAADLSVGTGPARRRQGRSPGWVSQNFPLAIGGLGYRDARLWAVRRELLTDVRRVGTSSDLLAEVIARGDWERAVEVPYQGGRRPSGPQRAIGRGITRLGDEVRRRTAPLARANRYPPVALPGPHGLDGPLDPSLERRRLLRAPTIQMTLVAWLTVAAFVAFAVFEIVLIVNPSNGPFLDEGIYIVSGIRTLHSHGLGDGYLGWFAGSLIWPALSGLAYTLGGLAGARMLAGALLLVGCAGSVWAARRLFGDRAALFATILLLGSAPTLALAHLAVIDVVAAAGLGGCLGAIAEFHHTNRRVWLVVAALAYAIGTLGKYPLAFTLPWIVLLLLHFRRRAAAHDIGIFFALYSGVVITYFLVFRPQLLYFLKWRTKNNPSFGVTLPMITFEQVLYGLPWLVVVIAGIIAAGSGQRRLATLLGSAILLFPAYHLLIANDVGADKHVVFGFLIAAPTAGLGLSKIAQRHVMREIVSLALVALTLFDISVMQKMDRSWPNESGVSNYLAGHMRPGQQVLVPDGWQVMPPLEGRVLDAPQSQLTDSYGFTHDQPHRAPCSFDWVVVNKYWNEWPPAVLTDIRACGFRVVYQENSKIIDLGKSLHYVSWTAQFVVYKRPGPPGSR